MYCSLPSQKALIVCWFKSLKVSYTNKWENWFINEPKAFPKYENLTGPGYIKICQWITNIWNDINPDLLKNNFKCCGVLSNKSDDYHSQLKSKVITNFNLIYLIKKFLFEIYLEIMLEDVIPINSIVVENPVDELNYEEIEHTENFDNDSGSEFEESLAYFSLEERNE